jgi:mycothiol system anti-sigma-R factor
MTLNPFETSACENTIHELYHFLDGELTEGRRAEIELHLNQCGPCEDVMRFQEELRRVLKDRCQETVPQELRDKIAALIHHESKVDEVDR